MTILQAYPPRIEHPGQVEVWSNHPDGPTDTVVSSRSFPAASLFVPTRDGPQPVVRIETHFSPLRTTILRFGPGRRRLDARYGPPLHDFQSSEGNSKAHPNVLADRGGAP